MRALILLALLGAALAAPKSAQRIVGGTTTSVEQFPYMANMQSGVFGIWWYHACGGTLITERTVLSAAHCYYQEPVDWWRVVLGTSEITSGGTQHELDDIVIHPEFNLVEFNHDVALVRLSNPAILSDVIALAAIAGPNYNLPDGTVLSATGWGILAPSVDADYPDELQHVNINQINQEICAERYAFLRTQPGFTWYPNIVPSMLCAGLLDIGGAGTCSGDSGGPLIHQSDALDTDVVVGITSWGYSCADATYPSVFARVSFYSNWIVENGSG